MIDALHNATLRELFQELLRRAEEIQSIPARVVLKQDVQAHLQYLDGETLDSGVLQRIQDSPMERLWRDLTAEIARQDRFHPAGYPATRDGVFMGLKTAVHELDHEAIDAWSGDRCRCETPVCGHADWSNTRAETLQAIAVLARTVRSIDAAEVDRGRSC